MYRNLITRLTLALVTLTVVSLPSTQLPNPARANFAALYAMPDLAIFKYRSSDPTPFAPGNEISYQIYYINQGGYVANNVRIVDTLPEHTTFVSSSQPGFVLIQGGPDQVVWVRDRLSVFERGWLSVTVRVDGDAPVGSYVENTAYILCLDSESNYDNNESVLGSYVLPNSPDLAVHKELQAGTYGPDHVISTRIHYRNQGGSAAANVRITDTLPAGCTYVSNDNTYGWTTAVTGSTVVWTHSTVPADSVGDVYVTFRLPADWDPASDWLENVAEIATTDAEAGYGNNLTRLVVKPEAHRRYGAAVTAVDDRTMRLASDAGFDYVLYYLDWSEAEPSDNQYDWTRLDAAAWQAWWWNLRLVVRVDRAPIWARGPGTATAPPTTPAKLGEFLQATAARWPRTPGNPNHPQVHGYVVWNEPNLAAEWGGNAPDAATYTSLLQAAYNGVKAGSPNAWVISAGLATTNGSPGVSVDDRTYLQAMYDAGAGAYFDRLGVNPLGFASAPDDTTDPNGYDFSRALDWRAIMVANGDGAKDMFATELGWLRDTANDLGSNYNWIKVSDVDQAHYLARAFHKASCEWVRPDGTPWMGSMMVWNLDLAAFDPDTSHRHWFSITGASRDPLRAYYTLQNAATHGPADLWVETEHVGAVSASSLQYAIRYTNVGGQAAHGVVLSDTLPAGTAYASDTGGGVPSGNQVVWNVGTVPTCTYEAITLTLKLAEGDPGGVLTNTVEASTQPGEPYVDDNADEAVALIPDLHIEKVSQPSVVAAGDTITYVLTYRNDGQSAATGVFVTDVVPAELIGASYDSDPVLAATPGFSYTWDVGTLAPGTGGIITVTGQVDPSLTPSPQQAFTNTASITGTTSAEVYHGDNSSTSETTVNGPTGITLVTVVATVGGNTIAAIWGAATALLVGIGLARLLTGWRRR